MLDVISIPSIFKKNFRRKVTSTFALPFLVESLGIKTLKSSKTKTVTLPNNDLKPLISVGEIGFRMVDVILVMSVRMNENHQKD